MLRTLRLISLLLVLAAGGVAQSQGFEVLSWPAAKPVPALTATDLKGRVWRLADLRGKAVLINFWASWCEPCRAEMPSLQALAQAHGPQQLVVLAVNFKEPAETARRFVQRSELALPVLLDTDGAIARQWGAKVFPTTVLLGRDGHVQAVVRGEFDWSGAQATRLVDALLAAPPARVATAGP
jgi:thiol-disulfide isomerase/thioredoxin